MISKLNDAIVVVGLGVAIAIICIGGYFAGGGFASVDYYTINRATSLGDAPTDNVYFEVVEVRKNGSDRVMYATNDMNKALAVLDIVRDLDKY